MIECDRFACSCGDPKHTIYFIRDTTSVESNLLLYLPVTRTWPFVGDSGFFHILSRLMFLVGGNQLELRPTTTIKQSDAPAFWKIARKYGMFTFLRHIIVTHGDFLYFNYVFFKPILTMKWASILTYITCGACDMYVVWRGDQEKFPKDVQFVKGLPDFENLTLQERMCAN